MGATDATDKAGSDAWQLKLGIIVPSWNTVMEYEWQRLAGAAMSVHSQRIRHQAYPAAA